MSQMIAELTAELAAPEVPQGKAKRARKDPGTNQKSSTKRGQPRPYKKISDELLAIRVAKLTTRLERVKKQVAVLT